MVFSLMKASKNVSEWWLSLWISHLKSNSTGIAADLHADLLHSLPPPPPHYSPLLLLFSPGGLM